MAPSTSRHANDARIISGRFGALGISLADAPPSLLVSALTKRDGGRVQWRREPQTA